MEFELAHTLCPPPPHLDRRHGILLVHGWDADRRSGSEYARQLAELGYHALAIDLPGHGESPGQRATLTRDDYLAAVEQGVSLLQRVGSTRFSLVGASFGGYLVALASARLPEIESLVLRVPADYPDSDWERPVPELFAELAAWRAAHPEESGAVRALRRFEGRVLLVESELDEVIPPEMIQRYREAAQQVSYLLMPGAPHSIGREARFREAYGQLLRDFFRAQD